MEYPCEYIGFVDSDDWIEKNMYEVLLEYAEESKSEIVNSESVYSFFNDEQTSQRLRPVIPIMGDKRVNGIDAVKALVKGHIGTGVWNKLWKRECFQNIRFPFGHVYEDTATVYKVFCIMKSVRNITCPLYHYRIREGSISRTYSIDNLIDFWVAHKSRYDFFLRLCHNKWLIFDEK